MNLAQIYKERIDKFTEQETFFAKRAAKFPLYRLLVFLAGAVVFYFAFSFTPILSVVAVIVFLIVFGFVTKLDAKTNDKKNYNNKLKIINENELKSLGGDYKIYDDGSRYMDHSHPYTSDLDIFGKASLFQFINRTTSNSGSDLLASMISKPAQENEIHLRQQAIGELKELIDWRQDFQESGQSFEGNPGERASIVNWLSEPAYFSNKKVLTVFSIIFPFITIALIIAAFKGMPHGYAYLAVLIQGIITYLNSGRINESYQHISKKVGLLKSHASLIAAIESASFKTEKLAVLRDNFILDGTKASDNLNSLSSIVKYLDFRLHLFFFPVNLITFWDLHWIRKMESWREKNRDKVIKWFDAMAEFEALSSFANTYFNHPGWVFPEIAQQEFVLKAKNAGHPLIKPKERVTNEINIEGKAKVMLITGSNMAGKSTYLRTVGVNIVLANAGAPVCATSFKAAIITPFTSMRIIDSLEENASSFYAELKRLQDIINAVKNREKVFFLLDEILRGTNSNDRHIGSKALIKQMIKYNGTGIIATHDLELGKLQEELPGHIENYSFDVQIEGERLFFDYKLHPGICKSLNASVLMKKMGIEI
ncbi:MAG: hypothetical protein M3Q58_05260 [Bacteroidota bacterium]|nr:hypothetical protein [Bacteroidota bacterium]